ncbi:MAG: hypothetical protein ACRDP6_14955, partial [Actinoallomurus sp.]
LFVRDLDETMPLGDSALIWVNQSDNSVSGAQVARMLESFATDHRVAIARGVEDLKDPGRRRHLYMAAGDSRNGPASWLRKGYPEFSRGSRTDVHPIAELGLLDPRGVYFVYGSPRTAEALRATFGDMGLHGVVKHPLSFSELEPIYLNSALSWAFFVVALAMVTVIGASIMLSAKSYGVLRLQGKSLPNIFFRDMRQLTMFWVLAVAVVSVVSLGSLGLYNRLAWSGLFVSVAAVIAGILFLVTVVTHAAMLVVLGKTELLRALKGELPARVAAASAYLVRVPALLVALAIAMAVVSSGQDVLVRRTGQQDYRAVGDTTSIALNGNLGSEESRMEAGVAGWIRQADLEGKVILAGRQELQTFSPPGSVLPQGEVLIVNGTFLAKQPVLDPAGRRYAPTPGARPPGTGPVQLIIPESLARYAPALQTAISQNLNAGHPETVRQAGVRTRWAKNGQQVFTYSTGSGSYTAAPSLEHDRSVVRDPVIVAVPNGSKVIPDGNYFAYASQSGVVFPDPRDVLDGIAAHRLQTYVLAVTPIAQNAALEQRDAVRKFRMQTFNLTVALAVLTITGLGVCIVYSRKNSQAIFVRHISGWRFTATHRSMLLTETLIAAMLLTWPPLRAWWENRDLHRYAVGGPVPHGRVPVTAHDLAIAAGLAVLDAGAVLVALVVFHRRIVKERSTEA